MSDKFALSPRGDDPIAPRRKIWAVSKCNTLHKLGRILRTFSTCYTEKYNYLSAEFNILSFTEEILAYLPVKSFKNKFNTNQIWVFFQTKSTIHWVRYENISFSTQFFSCCKLQTLTTDSLPLLLVYPLIYPVLPEDLTLSPVNHLRKHLYLFWSHWPSLRLEGKSVPSFPNTVEPSPAGCSDSHCAWRFKT